jgi:hypothetical protein
MTQAVPTVPVGHAVLVEDVPDPQVDVRASRRTYTAKDTLEILAEYERLDKAGKGALLRREGLYTSLISAWREQRDRGALTPVNPPTAGARPAVGDVPREHWDNPLYDPAHPHSDGTPRGEHGYVGTVDPDHLSVSGLTDSGRLHDPNVVPQALPPYVESGISPELRGDVRLGVELQVVDRVGV